MRISLPVVLLLVMLAIPAVPHLSAANAADDWEKWLAKLPLEQRDAWQDYLQRSQRQSQLYRALIAAEVEAYALQQTTAAPEGPSYFREALAKPLDWYRTDEARRRADIAVSFQFPVGGWSKGIDLATRPRRPGELHSAADNWRWLATFDNGSTYLHMRFIARAFQATDEPYYRDSFLRGLRFILRSQYPNGGFPQIYPLEGGYHDHITFNDNAMVGVLVLLRDIAQEEPGFDFVDAPTRELVKRALERATDCVVNMQVRVNGRRTAWCAQHHCITLEPVGARSYELPSLSGDESVGIVRFLMSLDNPGKEVIEAVQAAVRWLDEVKLDNTSMVRVPKQDKENYPRGFDHVVMTGPEYGPSWARFYEIGTNRPMFVGRDGVVKHDLAEVEYERRTGYRYMGEWAHRLLQEEYPGWQARWSPHKNVLKKSSGAHRRLISN